MKGIFLLGLAFGIAGFLIESIGASIRNKQITYKGDQFFWNIPILPIYSIGGLLMHYSIKFFGSFPSYLTIILTWFVISSWEYSAGIVSFKITKKKYWNYSKNLLSFGGWVCAKSTCLWLFFVIVYYLFLFHGIEKFL